MRCRIRRAVCACVSLGVCLACSKVQAQGTLAVDQASGTLEEPITQGNSIPENRIEQSFTPSLSTVGFVQFQMIVVNTDSATVLIQLREGSYDGPIVSSTAPLVLVNSVLNLETF